MVRDGKEEFLLGGVRFGVRCSHGCAGDMGSRTVASPPPPRPSAAAYPCAGSIARAGRRPLRGPRRCSSHRAPSTGQTRIWPLEPLLRLRNSRRQLRPPRKARRPIARGGRRRFISSYRGGFANEHAHPSVGGWSEGATRPRDAPTVRRRPPRVAVPTPRQVHHRDAATKAPGGTNPSEDPTLRSSLQGLATRILADALNTEPGENGAEGADTAVREPSSEATMRRHTHTKAFAGSMTRVNARGAVLPGHVGRAGASTASSRARSATPSPERGRPGWRPNGAAAPSGHTPIAAGRRRRT